MPPAIVTFSHSLMVLGTTTFDQLLLASRVEAAISKQAGPHANAQGMNSHGTASTATM